MYIPKLALDTYIALGLVLATPWCYRIFAPFMYDHPNKSRRNQILSSILLLHTLLILYKLFVAQPVNIFEVLGLTATAPPEYLKARIAEVYGGAEHVPEQLNVLVKRLGLIDMRSFYIRFGHEVLTTCDYCQSWEDFAVYSIPGQLLEYVREIALVGLLTLPNTLSAGFRPLGLGALMAAFLAEAYWTLTLPVHVPAPNSDVQVFFWHDYSVQLRHLLFLALPLLLFVAPSFGLHRLPIIGGAFPAPPAADPSTQPVSHPPGVQIHPSISQAPLNQLTAMMLQTVNHLIPALHLAKYTHAAVMRSQELKEGQESPTPFERAKTWWAQEAQEGEVVRNDPGVRVFLKAAGLSIEKEEVRPDGTTGEGVLLDSAKKAVSMFKAEGSRPSSYWVFDSPQGS